MFGIIEKNVIVLLASIVNACTHTKCVFLSNQKCKIQLPLLIWFLMNTIRNYTTIQNYKLCYG